MADSALAALTAQSVAIEHVLWAAGRGLAPVDVLKGFGLPWGGRSAPDWHDCVLSLAIAWRRIEAPSRPLSLVA